MREIHGTGMLDAWWGTTVPRGRHVRPGKNDFSRGGLKHCLHIRAFTEISLSDHRFGAAVALLFQIRCAWLLEIPSGTVPQ